MEKTKTHKDRRSNFTQCSAIAFATGGDLCLLGDLEACGPATPDVVQDWTEMM